MNLFLLGATGNTGREVLDLALRAGHSVTAFVRSPQKIERQDPRLRLVQGSPLDVRSVSLAMAGHDAVISTLGLPPRQALRPSTFMAESAATTVAAMREANVTRLAIQSAAVLFPGRGLGFAIVSRLLKHHARDLSAMETVVQATDLDWTIARPPRLVHAAEERYRCRHDALPEGGTVASFRAVAAFLVEAVQARQHVKAVVGVAR